MMRTNLAGECPREASRAELHGLGIRHRTARLLILDVGRDGPCAPSAMPGAEFGSDKRAQPSYHPSCSLLLLLAVGEVSAQPTGNASKTIEFADRLQIWRQAQDLEDRIPLGEELLARERAHCLAAAGAAGQGAG